MQVKKLHKIILPVGNIIPFIYCDWQGLMHKRMSSSQLVLNKSSSKWSLTEFK